MSKAEEFAYSKYPKSKEGILYDLARNSIIQGYEQAEKDCLLKINHLVNKVNIDNDAYENLEDLYDSLCELIKHNRIGYIPEKDMKLTWKDVSKIISIDQQVCGTMGISDYIHNHQQAMEEVLKRFKEIKDE